MRSLLRSVISQTFEDHRRALEEMRASAAEWTAVHPLAMSNGL
jgi:hypothetical protein